MPGKPLLQKLDQLRRRGLRIGFGIAAARGILAAGLCLAAGMWIDVAVDLPPALRIAATILAAGCGAAALGSVVRNVLRHGSSAALARRLDAQAAAGGQIVSGFDLLRLDLRANRLTAGLAELAIASADERARIIVPTTVLPIRPVVLAACMVGGLCLIIAAVRQAVPDLLPTEWRRFADPFGDHPAYSRIRFVVEPGNVGVLYGDGLAVTAQTVGPPVDRVDLVMESSGGARVERSPMFPEHGGRWRTAIDRVIAPARYFVRAGAARSPRFAIDVVTVPRIREVRARVTPPQYTHVQPYEGPIPPGGLAGVNRTRVNITAVSNRPLGSGRMTLRCGDLRTIVPLGRGSAANEVTGSFEIGASGAFELNVTDRDGAVSREPFRGTMALLNDERPMVRLIEPRAVSFATPSVTLPITADAEDDFGVARLQLFRSLNDSRSTAVTLTEPLPPAPRCEATHRLPLHRYGLKPGDVIRLFARAEDNDPDGAKGAESPVAEVRIISEAEYQQAVISQQGMEVLESKYAAAARRMEALRDEISRLTKELESAPRGREVDEATRAEFEKLAGRLESEADEIARQAAEKLPFDIDQALSEQLAQMAAQLHQASGQARQAAGIPKLSGADARRRLSELARRMDRQREQFNREAMQPMEHLARIFPMLEDEGRFIALYQHQRDLSQRMKSLPPQADPDDTRLRARLRDLEDEQRQVREQLQELLADIENHVAELPADPKLDPLRETAAEFAAAVRDSGASDAMSNSQNALAQRAGEEAATSARSAADVLEKFISRCQGVGKQGRTCLSFQPKLASAMGDSVQQMLNALGFGQGSGTGNGYSVSQNTMRNVGMYGNLPTRSGLARSGQRGRGSGTGAGAGGEGGEGPRFEWTATPELGDRGRAFNDPAVPTEYRRRVGAYFQRLAEESDADGPRRDSREDGGRP